MTDNTESQLETVIFQMRTNGDGPDFFDYLNPQYSEELERLRYDADRLVGLPEVEVSEEVYRHFLYVLPPVFTKHGCFVMREALTDSPNHSLVISSKFSQRDKRYFHQYIAIPVDEWEQEVDG